MKGRTGRAGGGVVDRDDAPKEVYAGAGSNVVKEAMERKRGGPVKAKKEMKVAGVKAKMRLDRPGRKMGGRVGADKSPLSSASRTNDPDEAHDMSADAGDYKRGGSVKKKMMADCP